MLLLLLDYGKEIVLNSQMLPKIKAGSKVVVLFSYNELFWNKELEEKNSNKLELLLKLSREKGIELFPIPACSAKQEIVEEFNRRAIHVEPRGFYTEGAYLKPIFLYKKIQEKGLRLFDICTKCSMYNKKCPGCFEVYSGRNINILMNAVLRQIHPKDIVVDIGCGQGFYIEDLVDMLNAPEQLFLIDPKLILLKELPTALNISFSRKPVLICSVAENIPLKSKICDVALLINSFGHFYGPSRAILEIFRVLKDGGRVYLIESEEVPEEDKAENYEKHNMLTKEEIKELFREGGFSIGMSKEAKPYYLLVFKKQSL